MVSSARCFFVLFAAHVFLNEEKTKRAISLSPPFTACTCFRYLDGEREVLPRAMFEMVTTHPEWLLQVHRHIPMSREPDTTTTIPVACCSRTQ